MCKKLLIAALAIVVGVAVVSSTRLGSHIRLYWSKGSDWAKKQVPLETEIERLEMELANLSKLDDRYYDQVARQKREVAKLRAKVTADKAALVKLEGEIKAMRLALADESEFVSYNGSRYSRKDVQAQVREDASKFQTDEKLVQADEEHLQLVEKTLAINEQKLKDLDLVRRKLKTELAELRREVARARQLQTQGQLTLDDSPYARLKKEIDEVKDRVEETKIKTELRGQSNRGPVRAQEEVKEEQKKLDKYIEERFGGSDTKKVSTESE